MKRKKTASQAVRMLVTFVSVVLIMVFVLLYVSDELSNNSSKVIELSNTRSMDVVDIISSEVKKMQEAKKSNEEINEYLAGVMEVSGSKFLVFEDSDEILFAKNADATSKLGDYREPDRYWSSVKSGDVQVVAKSWDTRGNHYSLSLVTETAGILDSAGITLHNYYIMLAVILVCFVLFIVLITLVIQLNAARKKLNITKNDLEERNRNIEEYMEHNEEQAGNNMNEEDFEKRYRQVDRIYDITVLRNLLSKSNDAEVAPVRIIFIDFEMMERYYSVDEIFDYVHEIRKELKTKEFLCELRKGLFAVVIYKTNEAETNLRTERFREILETRNRAKKLFKGFDLKSYPLGGGEDSVLEDFEKIYSYTKENRS